MWSGRDQDDKNKDKKNEEFNTGAAPGASNTAVMRPVRGADGTVGGSQSAINDIVRNARGSGAQGKGDAHDMPGLDITLYKNGFQVGDGEFRPVGEAKNDVFLAALKKGYVADSTALFLLDTHSIMYV